MSDKHCYRNVSVVGGARKRALVRLAGALFFGMCLCLSAAAAEPATDEGGGGVEAPQEVMMANKSIARLAEQASRMIPRHEYDAALDTANQGLSIDPTYIPLWRLKALAHIALHQNEEAEEALSVCLLRDPNDIEAHVLSLKNTLDWADVDPADKIRRVSSFMRDMDPDMLSKALASFMKREEFPEYVAILLEAWQKTKGPLDAVRSVLMEYSGNHLQAASKLMSSPGLAGLQPGLSKSLRDLIDQALDKKSTATWAVDKGELTRDGGKVYISAAPESDAFAWLRMSPGWRNVSASIRYPGAVNAARNLYLRYQSPESYVRISVADGIMLIQERVPGLGLSTLQEIPLTALEGQPLRLALKGERMGLYAGERPLVESAIPISGLITSGKVALGCENRTRNKVDALFDEVEMSSLEFNWIAVTGKESRDAVAEIFKDRGLTGVMVALGGEISVSTTLPSLLLAAVNSGMTAYALLPVGSTDLQELQVPLKRLPRMLAERIWGGVVVQPAEDMELRRLGTFLAEIKKQGLQSAMYLTPDVAKRLAVYDGDLYADWLLIKDDKNLPASVLADLGKFYGNALFEDPAAKDRFVTKVF